MRHPWLPLLVVVFTVALLGWGHPVKLAGVQAGSLPEVGVTEEEYAIYCVLVPPDGVVQSETDVDCLPFILDIGEGGLGVDAALFKHYKQVSSERWSLSPERLRRQVRSRKEMTGGRVWTVSRVASVWFMPAATSRWGEMEAST